MHRAAAEARRMIFLYIAAAALFGSIAARGLTVPLYAHQLGAGRFAVGALFSVATITAAALSLPSGVLVDRFGARSLLAVSLVVTAVSVGATALSTSVAPLFLWQVLGGLGVGMQQASLFAAVTESVPPPRLGRAMGWLTFSMQAGFFLGPSLSGLALSWIDLRANIAATTASLIFAVPGVLAAGNTRQRSSGGGLSIREPLLALARRRTFLRVSIGLLGVTLTWGTVGAFLPLFGKEALRLPNSEVGYLLALQAIVNAAARIPIGRLVDRSRRRWAFVAVGGMVWCAAAIALGYSSGFLQPAVLLLIGTPFMAGAFLTIGVIFGELAGDSTRGVTMGMYGTILLAGLSAGPLIFGPIVQGAGYATGFIACSLVAVALLLVMVALRAQPSRMRTARAPHGDSETQSAATRQA